MCYPCHRTLPQLLQFSIFMNLYFVYVINIRFICDGEIYLLTYLFISFKKRRTIKKWLGVIRCKSFLLTEYSRICGDRNTLLDYYLPSCMPLKTSVPSSFNFPQYLQKFVTERRQLERKSPHIVGETMNEGPSSLENFKLSPSKTELRILCRNRGRKSKH